MQVAEAKGHEVFERCSCQGTGNDPQAARVGDAHCWAWPLGHVTHCRHDASLDIGEGLAARNPEVGHIASASVVLLWFPLAYGIEGAPIPLPHVDFVHVVDEVDGAFVEEGA